MIHEPRALRLELPFDQTDAICTTLSINTTLYQPLYVSVNGFISVYNNLIPLYGSIPWFGSISTISKRLFAPNQK
jgi:hypothetical protein